MEAFGLEVEEDLSTLATQTWAWYTEQKEAWLNQAPEVQMWKQARGPAGCRARRVIWASSGHIGIP